MVVYLNTKPIFSDTDVLSCFLMIKQTKLLQLLYTQIIIPIYVYKEFEKAPNKELIKQINKLISEKFILVKDINTPEEYLNFINFKKVI